MFSTLLSATTVDLVVFAVLAVTTLAVVARFRDCLLLFTLDPELVAAVGMRRALTAVWLGVVRGLSLRVSGQVYIFGCAP